MGNSKDPNRYDPDFFEVLSLMEQGISPIKIERPTTKSAYHFKMMLYAFAGAWKHDGLELSKDNPELSQASYDRARVMARYKLKHEGNLVICENRDAENFTTHSKITIPEGAERAPLVTAANKAEIAAEILKELPPPKSNPAIDFFEDIAKKKAAETAEAKRKMREAQRASVPTHPELKAVPKAYAFDRPKEENPDDPPK